MKLIQLLLLVFSVAHAAGAAVVERAHGEDGGEDARSASVIAGVLGHFAVGHAADPVRPALGREASGQQAAGAAVGESGPLAAGAAVRVNAQGTCGGTSTNWWDTEGNLAACGTKIACDAACGADSPCRRDCDRYYRFWEYRLSLPEFESEADCEDVCRTRVPTGSVYDERDACKDSCSAYWEVCGAGGTVRPICPNDCPTQCEPCNSCCPDCNSCCPGPATCGSFNEADDGSGCDINPSLLHYLGHMTPRACSLACAASGAGCCERKRSGSFYHCWWHYVNRVGIHGTSGYKGVLCGADEDTKVELTTEGALDEDAAPVRRAAPRPLPGDHERIASALEEANAEAIEDLEKTNDELEKTVSALKEANTAVEAELVALRRLAAEEDEDEAKAPGAKAPASRFAHVNAIRALVRDQAAEGERGAVPEGEGEGEGGPP